MSEDLKSYTIIDMESKIVYNLPLNLEVTISSTTKQKNSDGRFEQDAKGKYIGEYKTRKIPISKILEMMVGCSLPNSFYLRPLIIQYNNENKIIGINAGVDNHRELIFEIRDRMKKRIKMMKKG